MENIGDRLYLIRKMHKCSQSQVAKAIGMDQSNYSKMEKGKRRVRPSTVRKLSILYGCPEEVLLGKTDEWVPEYSLHEDLTVDELSHMTLHEIAEILTLKDRQIRKLQLQLMGKSTD